MGSFKICAGLDLSLTCTGIAVITAPGVAQYYSCGYKLTRQATHLDITERVIYIANTVMKALNEYDCSHIGVENYAYNSKGKITMQAELGGTVKSQIYIGGMMPVVIASGTARKYLLLKKVKGKSIKQVVRDRLVDIGYERPDNTDKSDALAIAHVVSDWANSRNVASTDAQLEVFENIDSHLTRTVPCKLISGKQI
jgi:Holliday junction resolvasome RuvABC endonuclease subunit